MLQPIGFVSQTPCLPKPDLLEEMLLMAEMDIKVEFLPRRNAIGQMVTDVTVKFPTESPRSVQEEVNALKEGGLPSASFPWLRRFYIFEKDAIAAWLRKLRLSYEMMKWYTDNAATT